MNSRLSRATPPAGVLMTCATLAACGGPVEWQGAAARIAAPHAAAPLDAAAQGGAVAPAALDEGEVIDSADDASLRFAFGADGVVSLRRLATPTTLPTAADSSACAASLRLDTPSPDVIHGVWWSRRSLGRAALVAARSDDAGVTWTTPAAVDTTDQSTVACDRPAPAIFADPRSSYVHVTYFLQAREGPGVFFSHSMDRDGLFHAPVPIVYGSRPAASAVASADSVVVVAFENPNRPRGQISLAISRTWGHIFLRDRPDASDSDVSARAPLVAVRRDTIAVGWRDPAVAGRVLARVGQLRW